MNENQIREGNIGYNLAIPASMHGKLVELSHKSRDSMRTILLRALEAELQQDNSLSKTG